MQAIRLFVDVDSEDIHLPELKQFMGKRVEMIILESPTIQDNKEKKQNMKNFFDAAGKIEIDKISVQKLIEGMETAIASETSLRKDWLKAEEDKAWQDL
jgi:hypothetical protein